MQYLDTDLLIHALLLLFYLLLELLQSGCVRGSSIGLQYLNVPEKPVSPHFG